MNRIALSLKNGKTVGFLIGEVARISVTYSRHWFRRGRGYSLDAGVLARIEQSGARLIEFDDKERGQRRRVGVKTFRQHAAPIDYGYGLKLCAPSSCYLAAEESQPTLFDGAAQS